MIKAYASGGKGDAAYTKAAIKQAQASGMSKEEATRLVTRNANTRTRKSSRDNYVRRLGIGG